MNKKIKTYCLILAIVYSIVVIFSIFESVTDFQEGYKQGRNEETKSLWYAKTLHLHVVPIGGMYTYPEKIKNTLTGQELQAETKIYKILPQNSDRTIPLYLKIFRGSIMALALAFMAALVYLPILFFGVIKSATKGKMLEYKTIRKIQRIGYILIMYYIFDFLAYASDFLVAKYLVALENYRAIVNFTDPGILFLGIVTLLFAEILKVSRQLKEEQDLTI